MYKTRFRLWIFVGIIYVLITVLSPLVITEVEHYNSLPKQATVSVKNAQIKKELNEESINSTKLIVQASNNPDIIISEGNEKEKDGYINQSFYSPLVAIMKNEYGATDMFETVQNLSTSNIKGLDLKKLLYCYENDLTYKEGYSTKDTSLKNKKVVLYFDSNYEKEIKYLLIACLSNHLEITEDDISTYENRVNNIWNSAEKIDNVSAFLKEKPVKEFVIITPEYNISADNNTSKAMSLGTTVAIDFTVSYKEEFKDIVNNEKFMSYSGLRNSDYVGSFHKGNLSDADWTVDFFENKNIEDSFLNSSVFVPLSNQENNSNEEINENISDTTTEDTNEETNTPSEKNSLSDSDLEQSVNNNPSEETEKESMLDFVCNICFLGLLFLAAIVLAVFFT